ncbi:MAG: porin [Turneriella sp.]
MRALICFKVAILLLATDVLFAAGDPTGDSTSTPAVTPAPAKTEKPILRPGVFVDTYYASSAYTPVSRDRQYLTQIARDREFNINLAHLDATVEEKRLRGRLAVQFGTSVASNYQNETTTERYSNQLSVRNLQEAYVGYKLFDKLWLDAGVFFGHIGVESWISHSNWNYTRALMAENTPYYATGARLFFEATAKLNLQLLVLNGWQVITPTNRDKSLGTQVSYEFNSAFKIIHNAFAGNVAPDDTTTQYRFYSNLILQYSPLSFLQFAMSADVGAQKNAANNSYRQWYTGALHARWLIDAHFATALRLEYFIDPDQVMVATATENGFQTGGLTVNFDYMPEEAYRLRFEYRNFFSRDSVYRFSDGMRPQEHIFTAAASLKL